MMLPEWPGNPETGRSGLSIKHSGFACIGFRLIIGSVEFRWNRHNLDLLSKYRITRLEAELVVRYASAYFPRQTGKGKWYLVGKGVKRRLIEMAFVLDPDNTIYVIHALPVGGKQRRWIRGDDRRSDASRKKRRREEPVSTAKTPLAKFWDGPSYDALTDEERKEVAAYYNSGEAAKAAKPLAAPQQKLWDRLKQKPVVINIRGNVQAVSVLVENDLLARADRRAAKMGISRAEFFAKGLEKLLDTAAVPGTR
jgi:hypothetical protein